MKSVIRYIEKNLIPLSVSAICLCALYARLMFLRQHQLWADELDQLEGMGGTFLDLIRWLPVNQYVTYISGDHILIYPFFRFFSYNKWGLALPHIIATIAGFFILYFICKRYFKSIWAYLITFGIVCFNATLINHATEIRPYAVLPTLALAIFFLLHKISDLDFKLHPPTKIAAILFFILAIWFHVYVILMCVSSFLFTLCASYREKSSAMYFKNASFLIVIALCFAMPLWLYSVFGPHESYQAFAFDTFRYISNPLDNPLGFFKSVVCNLIGDKMLYFLFLGAAVPFLFSYEERRKQLLFLFFMIIMPIGLLLLSDLRNRYWFLQRQFIFVIPFFALFLGWTWESFFMLLKRVMVKK